MSMPYKLQFYKSPFGGWQIQAFYRRTWSIGYNGPTAKAQIVVGYCGNRADPTKRWYFRNPFMAGAA